jgi:hypothetical protein
MTRILPMLWLGAGLLCGNAWSQERMERLTLGDGATSIKGRIKGHDGAQYSFTTRPGQQLMIRLASSNPSAYINVEKDGAAEAVCQGALTGNVCAVRSEAAAEYVVDVYLMRNAARRAESAQYTLAIEPSAGTSVASGATSGAGSGAASTASAAKEAASAAVATCKSALALKSGTNAVFVLPVSHVPAAGGYEVFLSLKGAQWLCTTDSRNNVNRLEQR